MRHLVLGSSGKIGRHLVEVLRDEGEEVIEFDIEYSHFHDLRIPYNSFLNQEMGNCDFVHFLAFDVGGAKYLEKYQNSWEFISNNMAIMLNTFESLKQHKKPFIFSSSQMGYLTDSTYGKLKCIGEDMTKALDGIYVKFWNVYGRNDMDEKSHVITDFIHMAKQGKITARTNGKESRQFLYADDCARGMLELARNYNHIERNKHSFHITSFEWNSIREIAKILQGISGCELEFNDKTDQTHKDIKFEPDPYILNFWQPTTNITKGITKLYNNQ